MSNDSSAPGFLVPLDQDAILDDDALLDALQPIIVGIGAYLDPSLVRPRWQTAEVPNAPDYSVDWVGFGIARTRPDVFAAESHVDSGVGYDLVESSEEVDLLISCYGPNSQKLARRLREGFRMEQNRTYLQALKMDMLFSSEPVTLPALLHSTWVRRVDVTLTLRRVISVSYGILTVKSLSTPAPTLASGIDNGQYVTPIVVQGA